jgi:hypothetical protein
MNGPYFQHNTQSCGSGQPDLTFGNVIWPQAWSEMRGILRSVQPADIDAIWPQAWPLLAPAVALAGGRYNEPTLRHRAETMNAQLWVAIERGAPVAACLTWVTPYPTGFRECNIAFVGGAGDGHWLHWMGAVKAWAESIGCDQIVCIGRDGWERVLAPLGFKRDGRVLSLEIRNG